MRKTSNCAVSHGWCIRIRVGTVAVSLRRIRQYHRVFLSPYYWIPPHLRSSSRRPKSFEEGKGEEKRRGGSDESGTGGGGREKEREIEFLGCILKPVELSGTSGGKVGGRNGRAWTEFRIFPFVHPFLSQPVSFSTFDLFV